MIKALLNREGVRAALILILLLHVCFFPCIWGNRTLLESARDQPSVLPQGAWAGKALAMPFPKMLDSGAAAWVPEPLLELIRTDYLRERTLPLWNPYQGFGAPLAADMQSQPFYPLTVALSFWLTPRTYNWYILLRLFIAGICGYLYLRFFVSFIAALAGGVTSMLAGYYVLFITMPHLSVEVLLTASFLVAEKLLRNTTYRNVVWLGVVVFLAVVGGMPESSLVLLTFLCLYVGFRIVADPVLRINWRQKSVCIAIGIAAGFLLSAFLLLPFREYMKLSFDWHQLFNTGGTISGLLHDRPGLSIFTYLFPLLYGPPFTSSLAPGWTGIRNYVGLIGLFLALISVLSLSFRHRRGDRDLSTLTCFFFVIAVVLVLKRYGLGPVNVVGTLPFFQLLQFPKYEEPVISICVSILCAIGLERIMRAQVSIAGQAVALGGTFLLAPIAIICSWKTLNKELVTDHVSPGIPVWAVGLPVCLLLSLALLIICRGRSSWLAIGVLACLTAEAVLSYVIPVYYVWNHMAATATNPYVGAPFVSALRARSGDYRIFGRDGVLFPKWASAFGFFDIRDLDAMYYKKYFPFLREFFPPAKRVYGDDLVDRFTGRGDYEFTDPLQRRLLQLSSVKYFLSPTPITIPNAIVEGFLKQNEGHLLPGREAYVNRQVFVLDGVRREALLEHPPYGRLPYRIKVDGKTSLHFSYALHPAVFEHTCGAGAEFILEVRDPKGSIERLFSKYIDPKHNVNERHWMDGEVSLDKYRGEWIDLLLSTTAGPTGDTCADWATWSNFQLGDVNEPREAVFKPIFEGDADIYEYDDVLPRAAIYYAAEMDKNEEEVLHRLTDPSLNIFQTVVLDSSKLTHDEITSVQRMNQDEARQVQPASIKSYRSREVTIEAATDRNGIMVLNDSDYPGWTVEVDGRPSTWFTANYLFRGVFLKPGKHTVRFTYEPISFREGAAISLASLFCLIVFPVIRKARSLRGAKMPTMTKLGSLLSILFLAACSAPKPTTPSLTPEEASELLHYNNKAEAWITYVKKQDASCDYRLDLPDQASRPTDIDLDHIVFCGNRPSPKEFDASVSFGYDKDTQKWVITRFSS